MANLEIVSGQLVNMLKFDRMPPLKVLTGNAESSNLPEYALNSDY